MINKLLKLNNQNITHVDLLSIRHLNDYVSMRKIEECGNFNLYLIRLRNDNFIVVKVYDNRGA